MKSLLLSFSLAAVALLGIGCSQRTASPHDPTIDAKDKDAATAAEPCCNQESAEKPVVNANGPGPQRSAHSSLDSYRQRIEHLLPNGWSIQVGQDKLIVTRREKVLIGRHYPNAHLPPDPPALSIDNHIYLPGKGDPKKTVYIDEPDTTANGPTPNSVMRPMPYHPFEPASGQTIPETRNDVFYSHQQYVITIRFLPLVGMEDYQRLIAANKVTEAKLASVWKKMESRKLRGKYDELLPNNSDDEKLIAEYKQLKNNIRPLPRFYTKDHTVEIEDTLGRQALPYPPPDFADGRIGKEVDSIGSQIEKMFSPYPPAK